MLNSAMKAAKFLYPTLRLFKPFFIVYSGENRFLLELESVDQTSKQKPCLLCCKGRWVELVLNFLIVKNRLILHRLIQKKSSKAILM